MNSSFLCNFDIKKVAGFIHRHTVAVIIGLIILVSFGSFLIGCKDDGMKSDASTRNRKYFTCITIKDGDTLTDIAYEYISDDFSSLTAYIEEVKSINNLKGDRITCGATLVVPYYSEPIEEELQY